MKIFYAHGHVVHQNITGDCEDWKERSSFSEIFNDFEKAKSYLLSSVDELLHDVYADDLLLSGGDGKPFIDVSPRWKAEYINEYIDYSLVISEIDTDIKWNEPKEHDLFAPPQIDRYYDCDGREISRRYVYDEGKTEYEFRSGDEEPEAGGRFKPGDILEYARGGDCERAVFIVAARPERPANSHTPWENKYDLIAFDLVDRTGRCAIVTNERLHESDMRPASSKRMSLFGALGEAFEAIGGLVASGKMSAELMKKITSGKIAFNIAESWRDIPELGYKKKNP